MPPISDQDTDYTSSGSPRPTKPSQKATTAGVQIPLKNGRKNGTAKDGGGGALAAVTKNSSKAMNSKQSAHANRTQSTDIKPVVKASNGNPITSPLLDALSSAALDRSPSQHTGEWTRNLPAFSSSPSNLIQLDSPPRGGDEMLSNFGWTTKEQREVVNGHVHSASPPARRRPLSYQQDSNLPQGFDGHRSPPSSSHTRRMSLYSAQNNRYAQHPPLPHLAQAHFYGAPDANLILSPPTPGVTPGENGYHSSFDHLPATNTNVTEDVVVTGYEGGVSIFAVSKKGLNKISGLEGLRGGVINAKILPWTGNGRNSHLYPLIGVVIHGPVLTSDNCSTGSPSSEGKSAGQNGSVRGSPKIDGQQIEGLDPIEYYQTTVEIYSLGMKSHVATLLSLPKSIITIPSTSPLFRAPLPIGSLTIRADSGNVVVASGMTGETWIFRQGEMANSLENFRCIGKVWATVQQRISVETGGVYKFAGEPHASEQSAARKQSKASTLSMNGRWLAYCPSAPSSQISLRATVPGMVSAARVPGLNSQAPPNLPGVNCSVDSPGGDSMVKQIVQLGTQKFIEAGNYLTQQGLSAWNNYRNKPIQSQSAMGGMSYQTSANMTQQFPPTHGVQAPTPLVIKDPGLISILDLEALSHHVSSSGSPPHPLATFRVPHGCSFLSFAPNGLALFTASNKGDIQFVWDLMRIQYAKSSFLKGGVQGTGVQGPHVRQIAQFSRMTIARIVDVVWTSPHGERAAMVTENGTVHVLDLPASAFAWPPPRRRLQPPKSGDTSGESIGPALTATGVATSAVSSLWTAARPLVSRPRRSSVGISARTVTAQAGHGTQALAAGISRSVGAATGKMNEMRKSANTTKLHLPRNHSAPSRACVLLLNGKRNDSVVVLGGGVVRFYTIKNRRADRPADKQKASRGSKYVEFRLPSLPDFKRTPEVMRDFNEAGDLELTEKDIEESRWKARQSPSPITKAHGTESSIPQAEIESNAPYQPFHTDRRVGLHVYSNEEISLPSPSVSVLVSPPRAIPGVKTTQSGQAKAWAFGGSISAKKLDVGPPHNSDDDEFDVSADTRALPSSSIERVFRVSDSMDHMEQIVITTRIPKAPRGGGSTNAGGDDEGFFEDDCDVLDFASQRV